MDIKERFVKNWKEYSKVQKFWMFVSFICAFVGCGLIYTSNFTFDKTSQLFVAEPKWMVGLLLYSIFTLIYIFQSKWKKG
jgi:hypothetical protein